MSINTCPHLLLYNLLFINTTRSSLATKFEPSIFASKIRRAPKSHFEPLTDCSQAACFHSLSHLHSTSTRDFAHQKESVFNSRDSRSRNLYSFTSRHSFYSPCLLDISVDPIKLHTIICDTCDDFFNTFSEPAVCAIGFRGKNVHEFKESKQSDKYCEHLLHFQCAKCDDDKEKRDSEAYEQAEAAEASGSGPGSGGQAEMSQEQVADLQSAAASALEIAVDTEEPSPQGNS
jgi:hypothetical protein